ncbi:CBO0543 family protein [Bacillus sp. JJ1521]|uniref:CBO0543 family protein n=1 Tax=Bacillus sp. JJ1521 TaxID=3122957 RepID=UPI002FFF345F
MQLDHFIMIAMWILGSGGFFLLITRQNRREGLFALLVFQSFIWICDMFSFYYGLISAPVREFPKATGLPITINYFFYPLLFSIYYVHQRKMENSRFRWIAFFASVSIVTVIDILIERYTQLLEYQTMTWYWMLVYIGFLFFVSQVCCHWFYRQKSHSSKRWITNEN